MFIHWADKKKAKLMIKRDSGICLTETEAGCVAKHCDQRLIVEKQRNGEFEGTIGLCFGVGLQFNEGRQLTFQIPRSSGQAA